MTFNSLTFGLFFGVVLLLHRLPFSWPAKKRNLLLASYAFYMAWNPPFVILIWISTVVDWIAARRMYASVDNQVRKAYLILSIVVNLGLLGYFKYRGFFLENFVLLARAMGLDFTPAAPGIVLPVGISFYTFQTMSYSLDVYRKRIQPWSSFQDFALFVTFFPQLLAGPIVRARDLLPQFLEEKRAGSTELGWGLTLLTIGLFEKIVLADGMMSPIVDSVYANVSQAGTLVLWVANMSFGAQLFFDFSGYSLCGIGAALCLGFVLPDNFRFPFACVGFFDFWRRWHISLSKWMRDYVYVPMGRAMTFRGRAVIAGSLAMAVVGLWHGAAWGFVLWGCANGVCLIFERLFSIATGAGEWKRTWVARRIGNVFTMVVLVLLLSLFRAPRGVDGLGVIGSMLSGSPNDLELRSFDMALGLGMLPLAMIGHIWLRNSSLEEVWNRIPSWGKSAILAALLVAIAIAPRNDRAFIYFQF